MGDIKFLHGKLSNSICVICAYSCEYVCECVFVCVCVQNYVFYVAEVRKIPKF